MNTQKATFAGGCFWCMQSPFEKHKGVLQVISGYTGGTGSNPTYQDYAQKGHQEAVEVIYDPSQISYKELLAIFWQQIDPTDAQGQFADRGLGYTTAIFYHTPEQKKEAEQSKQLLQASKKFAKPIATQIKPATFFYPAEEYHQDFYKKNPEHYQRYRYGSGRDAFLQNIWNTEQPYVHSFQKPSQEQLQKQLTPLQYAVTQKNETEPPFANEFYATTTPGIYVDIVSGEPLFSSLDKYDSGCGWPSFTKSIENTIIEKDDFNLPQKRIEVRSKTADSHLGHVFDDGPAPTGLRYCINSAALRFIAYKDLEKEGYGKYKKYFFKP